MKTRLVPSGSGLWMALGAFVLAAGIAVAALMQALHIDETVAAATEKIVVPRLALSDGGAGGPERVALNDDPFSPTRTAPAVPYRLGSGAPLPTPDGIPRLGDMAFILFGTVVGPDGDSFATYMDPNEGEVKHIRVGEKVGFFTVESIERSHVIFRSPSGQRVDVRPSKFQG